MFGFVCVIHNIPGNHPSTTEMYKAIEPSLVHTHILLDFQGNRLFLIHKLCGSGLSLFRYH